MTVYPLSDFQREYVDRDRRRPGTYATVLRAFELTGPLRIDLLSAAVRKLARRHEALRIRLVDGPDGEPGQVVDPTGRIELSVEECGPDQVADRERAAALEQFDLWTGPLVRARLLRLDNDRHVLLVNAHHVICDGWSMQVLLDDLAALYAAAVGPASPTGPAGPAQPPPPPPIGLTDAVIWQRAHTARELRRAVRYWGSVLDPPPADLPFPAVAGYRNVRLPVRYGPETTAAVAELARTVRTSPYIVLLAGFQAVVAELTDTTDVVVSSLFAGRDRPGFTDVVGLLATITLVRTTIGDNPTFAELTRRVRAAVLDASELAGVQAWRAIAEVPAPPGDRPLAHRLAGIWLNVLPAAGRSFTLPDVAVVARPAVADLQWTKDDADWGGEHLALTLASTGDSLVGHLDYNAHSVPPELGNAVINRLQEVMVGLVGHANQHASDWLGKKCGSGTVQPLLL